MKKLLIVFILLISVLFITACSGDTDTDNPSIDSGVVDSDNGVNDDASGDTSDDTSEDTSDDKSDNSNEGSENETEQKHTVTFYDENGTQLYRAELEEGSIPSYSYSVIDTAEWNYTFVGWSKAPSGEVCELSELTKSTDYYAIVSREKQVYTVSFDVAGGSYVEAQAVEYGATASIPEAPKYDGHRFVGWCKDAELSIEFDWSQPVTENITVYAKWNEKVDIAAYLTALLDGYAMNPTSYIPEAMLPGYSSNLVSPSDVVTDYSEFVNVSDIISHGHGEQWNMIITNINQSMLFYNLLTVVETLSSTSVAAFNNYLDTNTSDTAHHTFESGIYNVTISFDGVLMTYVVDYTAELPVFGEQTAQIALCMDITSGEKTVRIQAGDANALTYTVLDGSYEFAIKYLGVRRAYFSVEDNGDGTVSGHIYEYVVAGEAEIASAADFYITDEYVCATGNKADGLIGFTGYIAETYDAESGRLIGYEVEETLSAITYNTVWLDLDCFDGISSVRYEAATEDTEELFFINGKSEAWESKAVGGFGFKMLSRRFDIEFRTQYFYSYDAESDSYVTVKAQVPMLFVQEESYDTLISDVSSVNGVTLIPKYTDSELELILANYDLSVEVFKTNKDLVTTEIILALIGEKIIFT